MAIGVRVRFEVFKRDDFTCQYCGRKSPEVVLEVDHIVPRAGGGRDDPVNLRTSCWECNSGKSDKPLSELVTGEDPHDRAVVLLERERQLREYNKVLADIRLREDANLEQLLSWWRENVRPMNGYGVAWLKGALTRHGSEEILRAMRIAVGNDKYDTRYVQGILRNWKTMPSE